MSVLKNILTWYLNRYSTAWNQDCDICWAGYIAFVHFLYGQIPLFGALLVLIITQVIKQIVPTQYDRERAE